MSGVKVEIIGGDRIRARLLRLQKSLPEAQEQGVRKVAEHIRDTAKRLVRVDTGSLRKSIRLEATAVPAQNFRIMSVRAGGYVVNPKTKRLVNYAKHQEWGTSRRGGFTPYLRPALEQHRGELKKELREVIVKNLWAFL